MAKFDIRWAQLDVARQMETVEFIEKFIVLLADSGYNGLLLYLEDRIKTASYQLPADNEVYTADDIKRIVKFAAEHNVEVVPCVATLGHAERFLRHKELEHLAELQGDMIGRFGGTRKLSFCVTHPDFYDFFRHTFCSDEMFVQTTLMHMTPIPNIVGSNERFMIWRRSMSPADLVEEEWRQVWSSNCLIARKFLMEPGETERYLAALNADF